MANSADPDQLASDLDLHCLPGQGMLCSAREGLKTNQMSGILITTETTKCSQPAILMT